MMLLMFGVFYFILIRPQVKRQKEHANMLANLKKGDMIITRGGVVGKISGISDQVLTVELQEKVRVRVMRSHVDGKYDPDAGKSADAKAA
jgi:preprotein translocase subunit YajC